MAEDFDTCLSFTLREEGGFVDDPADPGGATNMGITLATLRSWTDDPATGVAQIRQMTSRMAEAIYGARYWNPIRGDALPRGVDLSVFDFGVNAGTYRSAMLLQQALGFPVGETDGCIGPQTLAAAVKADACRLIEDLASRQAAYYRALADFPIFGRGWLARTAARRAAALAMIQTSPVVTA